MKTNKTNGRRFTPAEEQCAVSDLLGGRGGSALGRPYLALGDHNGRQYWVIKRRGLPSIHTGIPARDVMLASAELLQARWAWETYQPRTAKTLH